MASRNNTKLFIKSSDSSSTAGLKVHCRRNLEKFPAKPEDLLSTKSFYCVEARCICFAARNSDFVSVRIFFSRPRQCTINFIADVVVLAQHYEIRFVGSSLDFSLFLSAVSSFPTKTNLGWCRKIMWMTHMQLCRTSISNFEAKGGRTESAI